jgi:peptide deformylase
LDTEIVFLFLFFWQWQCICNQQETLRVKDNELHQLLQDVRARDSTINEIADKLQETAEAAETAASAALSIDEEKIFYVRT